jgi:DNA helicase-2/ATP-dependent DNA helicase PcrA
MNGTSYRIVGGLKFYERMEVKDVLCYFKLLLNPADDVAFKRIVNTPTRGIGKTSVEKLEEISARERIPLLDAISRAVQEKIFNSGTTKKLVEFGRLISDMAQDARQLKTSDLYHLILDKTQYAVRLKEENTPESLARLENLEELDNAINQFEQERGQEASVQTFLEEMALVSDADDLKEDRPSVTMMTLHISKGLEFPVVFIVGLEEGLFPSGRAIGQNGDEDVEEERRLMYVGMTRAREKLLLTWARHRKVWGVDQNHTASRFLSEIPESFVDREGQRKSDFLSRHAGIAERAPVGRSAFSRSTDRHRPFGDEAQVRPDFETDDDTASLRKGMRVRHPTFGVGSIFEVDGRGEDTKVSVVFSGNVVKKFVAKYARLERL